LYNAFVKIRDTKKPTDAKKKEIPVGARRSSRIAKLTLIG